MGRPTPPESPNPLPETPHDPNHHSISDIGQFITNLFHSRRDGKTRHVCSSSGPPQTHPSLDEDGATYTGKVPIERTDRFNCTGGVDAIKLLRGLRSNLLENAIAFGANVLVDEQYVLVLKRLCPVSKLTQHRWDISICTRQPPNYRVTVSHFVIFFPFIQSPNRRCPTCLSDTLLSIRNTFTAARS
jgi:hypothetical protein